MKIKKESTQTLVKKKKLSESEIMYLLIAKEYYQDYSNINDLPIFVRIITWCLFIKLVNDINNRLILIK